MIRAVRANKPRFKTVHFKSGLNLIIADKASTSSKKETRNGTGKSSLLEIVHFCLGSNIDSQSTLAKKELEQWTFFLDIELLGCPYTISRSVIEPAKISIVGDIELLGLPTSNANEIIISVTDFRVLMGKVMFSLPERETKYTPTFRSLISYFARRYSIGGTLDPFKNSANQLPWDIQVSNSYLLNLNWEDAQRFQRLKDREKRLDNIKELIREEVIPTISDDIGELESEKVRLNEHVSDIKNRIDTFKVHENYKDIELEANALTDKIHEITNRNFEINHSISLYRQAIENEDAPDVEYLEILYHEAKITLPELVKHELFEARKFHDSIVSNRKSFLSEEINSLQTALNENYSSIKELSNQRAEKMEILRTHGALNEYTLLNQGYADQLSKSLALSQKIEQLKLLNQGKNAVKAEKVKLETKATENHQEIKEIWQRELSLFNEYSMSLYESPGNLIINIGQSGFKFDIRILRGESQAFGKMKIFCYDLVLATLWSKNKVSPGFIFHDSSLFDGVDERQVAYALQLSAEMSSINNFQYICCMNSDEVPIKWFSEHFNVGEYVRLKLDDTETGGLFGFRF